MRDIIDAVENGDLSRVATFLDQNPALLTFSPFGETPLHVAVQQGKTAIVRFLLERGADVNLAGNNGHTPLHLAAARGKKEIAELLLQNNANVESVDDFHFTPLFTAARRGEPEIANLLIEHGAIFDLASAVVLGRVDRVNQLLDQDRSVIMRCRFKDDLLCDAVYAHVPELVRLLLAQPGMNANTIGSSGESPLVAAVSRSDYSEEIVNSLLQHGANPSIPSSSGDTAVTRAKLVGIQNADDLFP